MTNSELAILGLIIERPMHGYEVEQMIEERSMRNWTEIGFSSIYYVLKKLEDQALVDSSLETRGAKGPTRKVYRPTAKGRSAWRQETRRALGSPKRQFPEIYLGLAGMPGLSTEDVVNALETYLAGLDRRSEEMSQSREKSGPHLPIYVEAMFRYGEAVVAAERRWATELLSELNKVKESK